jgi:cyclohexanecarboxylate-CoA ligase
MKPTLTHSKARQYLRQGGPWDRGPLDSGFSRIAGKAVVSEARTLDGPALDRLVGDLAGRLAAAGAGRGKVVSWQLPNGIPALALYRACWRIGAVAAPLHHRLGSAEVEGALDQVEPAVLIADPNLPASGRPGALSVARPLDPAALLEVLPPASAAKRLAFRVRASDLAVALFTSGSTGIPKAVLHTHRGLGYKACLMAHVHGLRHGDVLLMPAPLAHVSGLLNGVLMPAVAGLPSVLMAKWDPELALSLAEREKVSFIGAPPVFFSQMAESGSFAPERVRSLRLVSTGGASVSPAFVEETAARFSCRVKRTYGSTEAPTVTTSGPADPFERARDTDGRAVGEAEITVRDPSSGQVLPPGEKGEIWIRGPELFVGYADLAQTASTVARPGGWYKSGDLGVLDEGGWLTVAGRLSDTIIRAGENISAAEVEAVLESHPAVHQAVVVGVPDPRLGERVAAAVVARGAFELDECRKLFESRGVTRFKTPEVVVVLEAMPMLAAGKPDRAAVRELALAAALQQLD